MSAQAFDEWWSSLGRSNNGTVKEIASWAWHSRDAEVAELKAKLDGVLLDKGLSEVMKSQLNARIQNCEAALEERDQQLMDAQAKLTESQRLNRAALEAMEIADEELSRKRIVVVQIKKAIKEIKGSKT